METSSEHCMLGPELTLKARDFMTLRLGEQNVLGLMKSGSDLSEFLFDISPFIVMVMSQDPFRKKNHFR